MFTTNKIFVDSSIFVEAIKGNKTDFYNNLISTVGNEYFINEVVLSEYLFYALAVYGGSSPQTLKERGVIPILINTDFRKPVLKYFSLLNNDVSFFTNVPDLMVKYNLLPNDAIILATCKLHAITKLASHDTDFIIPCKAEGIDLLRED
jgi:predicted nucleic acid-binding protein